MDIGCWAEVISKMHAGKTPFPSLLWGHDWATPVGRVDYAEERGNGLYIKGRFNLNTTRGRDAYEDVRFGSIRELSVGFLPADDGIRRDSKGVRHVSRVAEWPEVSFVLVGASPDTRVMSVKEATQAAPQWTPEQLAWWYEIYGPAKTSEPVEHAVLLSDSDIRRIVRAAVNELSAKRKDPAQPWFMTDDAWQDYLARLRRDHGIQ
jgi:HK97 family phage prohead protease